MGRMLAAFGLIFLVRVAGQEAKRLDYEVASIRPAPPDRRNGVGASGGPGTSDPTHVRYNYFLLRLLLMTAYDLPYQQISLPARLDRDERYDVLANVPPGATTAQARVMLQNFLIERFHLKVHRGARGMQHYELTVARNGPRLTAHKDGLQAPDEPPLRDGDISVRTGGDRNHMYARKVQIGELTRVLSDDLATPVLDKTELTGVYDFDFEYSREGLNGFRRSLTEGPEVSNAPTLQVALEEKLGLKLQSRKGLVDMLVVDAGNPKPSEN